MLVAVLVLLAALSLPVADARAGARWSWPVEPHLAVAGFSFDARTPYRAGMRRAIRIRTRGASQVRAPCPGRVHFAGRLPRGGIGLTIVCDDLLATLTGLRSLGVTHGQRVRARGVVGSVDGHATLGLSARAADGSGVYRDPIALLARPVAAPITSPWAPAGHRRPPSVPRPAARPPVPAGRVTPPAAAAPALATHVPPIMTSGRAPARRYSGPWASPVAWLGLGLLGAALGSGVALHLGLVRRLVAGRPRLSEPRRSELTH